LPERPSRAPPRARVERFAVELRVDDECAIAAGQHDDGPHARQVLQVARGSLRVEPGDPRPGDAVRRLLAAQEVEHETLEQQVRSLMSLTPPSRSATARTSVRTSWSEVAHLYSDLSDAFSLRFRQDVVTLSPMR
jgi:hypothetical protein